MASGDTLIVLTPLHNEPPASAFATLDTRNGFACLDFNDTTDEEAIFRCVMPRHYGGGGLTITLGWAATDVTVTPHNVVWQVDLWRVANDADDIDSPAFVGLNTSGAVAEASASGELSYDTVTFTDGADMDSIAVGEMFFLKVRRDADDTSGTDSLTDDAELYFIEVKET